MLVDSRSLTIGDTHAEPLDEAGQFHIAVLGALYELLSHEGDVLTVLDLSILTADGNIDCFQFRYGIGKDGQAQGRGRVYGV